jgi:transposase
MLADALGRPLRFIVTAGQVGDITQAPALLDGQSGDAVLADKPMTVTPCARSSPGSAQRR